MTRLDKDITFRKLATWILNLAVLASLAGIGYWGHVNHWQFPKFAELRKSAQPAPNSESPATESHTALTPALARDGSDADPSDTAAQPLVRFRSLAAVRHADLESATAEARSMHQFVMAHGVVTYDQTRMAQLSARAPGIVWRVEKHLGELVRKGDVLAIVDSLDVGRAKAELLHAIVLYDHKSHILELENKQKLQGVTSERERREAESALREARIRRFNAQQALLNLGLPIKVEDLAGLSDDDLARRTQFLGLPEAIVSSLDPATTTGNLIPLVAPFDGVVIGHEITCGEVVETNQPQFVIADVRRMWIQLEVPREDAARLAAGQEVHFAVDGMPAEVRCRLTWISTEVDEKTRNVQVRAEVDNPLLNESPQASDGQRLLRANAFGTGRVLVRSTQQALAIPTSAIHWVGSRQAVFVRQSDGLTFELRHIRSGMTQDGFTEILEGIAAGDQVVVSGSHLLKSEVLRVQLASGETAVPPPPTALPNLTTGTAEALGRL